MNLFNTFFLTLQGLLLLHFQPVGAQLQDLLVEENGELVPLNRSSTVHMQPHPGYEGLPMKTQWNEEGEVQYIPQIELLDVDQYRKHFLDGPSWADVELSDEDAEDIR